MISKKFLYVLAFVLLYNPSCVIADGVDVDALKNPKAADKIAIDNGKQLYMKKCAVCHGEKANGNGPASESFEVPPWNFIDGTIDDVSDGYLFQKIKNGGPWFEMPPFGLALNDDDIWNIVSFLRANAKKI